MSTSEKQALRLVCLSDLRVTSDLQLHYPLCSAAVFGDAGSKPLPLGGDEGNLFAGASAKVCSRANQLHPSLPPSLPPLPLLPLAPLLSAETGRETF